ITVQSTRGVKSVETIESNVISDTLSELSADFDIAGIKVGMLGSAEAARAVGAFLKRSQHGSVVLDPVLRSSSGMALLSPEGIQVLKERLLRVADVITPNIDEAAQLAGIPVRNLAEMEEAARQLQQGGAQNVIITGGHLDPPVDLVRSSNG